MPSAKKYKIAVVLATVALLLILTTKAKSMFTVYVFSEVKGQVVSGGKPVAGATLVRSYDWAWGNQQGRDETKTDANGEFEFPPIKKRMILGSLFPHQPHIRQVILIKIENTVYKAWGASKWNYALHGEIVEFEDDKSKYHPMNLYCDVQIEPTFQKCGYQEYHGMASLRHIINK